MAGKEPYVVESKQEIRAFGKGGEVETQFRIWATTAGGTYFHVDVPEAELERAGEHLEARAKQLDAIK